MSRKKLITLTSIAAAVLIGVGITLAFMTSSSAVSNTFTVGNVKLTLEETTGTTYQLTPGTTLTKDPVLTVKAGSEASWVFFKAGKDSALSEYVDYEVTTGWILLDGYTDVYYRRVEKTSTDRSFTLLAGDTVRVKDTVTEEQLNSLKQSLKLAFTGYAIQRQGFNTPQEAWAALTKEVTRR